MLNKNQDNSEYLEILSGNNKTIGEETPVLKTILNKNSQLRTQDSVKTMIDKINLSDGQFVDDKSKRSSKFNYILDIFEKKNRDNCAEAYSKGKSEKIYEKTKYEKKIDKMFKLKHPLPPMAIYEQEWLESLDSQDKEKINSFNSKLDSKIREYNAKSQKRKAKNKNYKYYCSCISYYTNFSNNEDDEYHPCDSGWDQSPREKPFMTYSQNICMKENITYDDEKDGGGL